MPARRLPALVAVLAILLQSLWPLIAQARPRAASTLVPVCTVEGVTHYIELRTDRAPADERASSHVEHCGLCVLGADRVALPAFQVPSFDSDGAEVRPDARIEDFQRFSPTAFRSRAPPASMFVNRKINEHGEGNERASALLAAGAGARGPA